MGTPFSQLYKKDKDGKIFRHSIRLGDKVERVAQPIAKAIDKTFKTNLQNCGACKRRKDKLNSIL